MKVLYRNKFFWIQSACLFLLLGYSVYGQPSLSADSMEYIHFSPIRPPFYPFFLWIFSIFGQYQFMMVKWIQGIIMTTTLFYMWYWLGTKLKMPMWLAWLVVVITAWSIVLRFEINISILSEALAFPLFIICVTLFVDCFKDLNFKKAILFIIVTNLIVLTRAQFYYLYLLFPFLLAWYCLKKISRKYIQYTVAIMLSSVIGTMIINHSYHYYVNGHFSDSSVVGPQLVASALYLSNSSAEKYITDPSEKIFFNKIMKILEKKRLTRDTSKYIRYGTYNEKTMYYKLIFQWLFHEVYYENLNNMSSYQLNSITVGISKKLYMAEFRENVKFYLWKVMSIFGGFPLFFCFMFITAMYLVRIAKDRNYSPSYFQVVVGTFSLIVLLNVFFVAIFVIASERYFIYSNFLIFCLGCALADRLFGVIKKI